MEKRESMAGTSRGYLGCDNFPFQISVEPDGYGKFKIQIDRGSVFVKDNRIVFTMERGILKDLGNIIGAVTGAGTSVKKTVKKATKKVTKKVTKKAIKKVVPKKKK